MTDPSTLSDNAKFEAEFGQNYLAVIENVPRVVTNVHLLDPPGRGVYGQVQQVVEDLPGGQLNVVAPDKKMRMHNFETVSNVEN